MQIGNMPFTATAEDAHRLILSLAAPQGEAAGRLSSPSKEWLWGSEPGEEHFQPSHLQLQLTKAGKSKGVMGLTVPHPDLLEYLVSLGGECGGRPLVWSRVEQSQAGEEDAGGKASNHHPTTVYVTRLPLAVKEADLSKLMSSFGPVVGCRVMIDKLSKLSKVRLSVKLSLVCARIL